MTAANPHTTALHNAVCRLACRDAASPKPSTPRMGLYQALPLQSAEYFARESRAPQSRVLPARGPQAQAVRRNRRVFSQEGVHRLVRLAAGSHLAFTGALFIDPLTVRRAHGTEVR